MEIELKLLLDPEDADALQTSALLKQHAIDKPYLQELDSTYFDTPDLYFRRHGASLRVRHVKGDGWIQTLKGSASPSAGLQQRDEWETPLRGPLPKLAALRRLVRAEPHWKKILSSRTLSNHLVPLFTTHVKRTIWTLRLPLGDDVELALDQGDVAYENLQTPISEIELELKSGEAAHLFDFALQLQDAVPLHIDNTSKADRGFALLAPQSPAIVTAGDCELSAAMTVEQGFQAIVLHCLGHIEANVAGVAQGQDPESVHQMRVGLRRLRSALSQFKKLAPLPALLQSEIDWLNEELGAARDWEVLSVTTLPLVTKKFPDSADLSTLQNKVAIIAAEKRALAATAVSSARYTHFMLAFAAWTQGARWRESLNEVQLKSLSSPVRKFADKAIEVRQRGVRNAGKSLSRLDDVQRHRMRIGAKKLRYATEFFASLYPSEKNQPFVRSLMALQSDLGEMNDTRMAAALMHDIGKTCPELMEACGFAHGYLAAQSKRKRHQLERSWKRFRQMRIPRR